MATEYGGYDYSFVKKKLEKVICSICTKVLRDPHLTGCCGQHYCESCLQKWFTKHRKESCPHCQTEGSEFTHILDKKFKREIDSLKIYCTNKEEGCQWVGEVGSLNNHLTSPKGCGCVSVGCPYQCKVLKHAPNLFPVKMKRNELKNHLENECYLRPYKCEHCGHKDRYMNITGHANQDQVQYTLNFQGDNCHYLKCPEFPLECPNKCGEKGIKRKDMKDHRSQCPEEPVQCPFEEAGCKEKLVRHEMEQHMSTTQQQHLLMVMGAYKEVKRELQEMKMENSRKRIKLEQSD